LAFAFLFSAIVFVHEFGHFIVAKLFGVRVDEFGFGYPPRLFSLGTWKGTEYTINALPVGGFVKFGEDDTSRPDSMGSQSKMVRALSFAAGPLMNLLLAVVCYTLVFMFGQQQWLGRVIIKDIAADSPAAVAGLQAGDEVLQINDVQIESTWDLRRETEAFASREITLLVQRGTERLTFTMIPRARPPAGQGPLGVVINLEDARTITLRYPIWQAVPASLLRIVDNLAMIVGGLVRAIRGAVPLDVTGPIGLYQVTGEVAKSGWVNLVGLIGLVSVNLFFINLLPFPPLDGGHILFIVLEVVRSGRRVEIKKEGLVHFVGMIILLALMLLVTYRDVLRLIRGESILP